MHASVTSDGWLRALGDAPGARALFRDVSAWGVDGLTSSAGDLDGGFHVVAMTFEGELRAARMAHVARHPNAPWAGAQSLDAAVAPHTQRAGERGWASSLDRSQYEAGVRRIHEYIAAGDVYQVNLCRTMTSREEHDLDALFLGILEHNPALHACRIDVSGLDEIVSASPETFLRRDGERLASAPIKGTAVSADAMLAKDVTENVMITDLVRNDLQRVCEPGTVAVDGLLRTEQHPGLVHLVSTVVGKTRSSVRWSDILAATGPPGSVSGAPKTRALEVITELEDGPRGPYCGAIGWIDAETGTGELAVGIRTFWAPRRAQVELGVQGHRGPLGSGQIHFGVGAGITWESDPSAEWQETELKAQRLLAIAAGAVRREYS